MRKQIAAANWKMNLNLNEAESLVRDIVKMDYDLNENRIVLMAVPFPYLINIQNLLKDKSNFFVCAQNCASTSNGAYTGEISAQMLRELDVKYVIIGHSERRTLFSETNEVLAKKVDIALQNQLNPVFCFYYIELLFFSNK